jgi:Flp pilus assembly protein protease CpaA
MKGVSEQHERVSRREFCHVDRCYIPGDLPGHRPPTTDVKTANHQTVPPSVHLPLGIGAITTAALGTAVAILAAMAGWLISGAAVAIPLALVGGVALVAAIEDAATGRIPNSLVLTGLVIVGCSWGFVATVDNRLMRPLGIDLLAGFVLGGAPVVFVVWLVAPRLIGGGDWKLLGVLGAAVGTLAPSAASLIPLVAFGAALCAAATRRRRDVRLGPFLAAGYVVALVAALAEPAAFGTWYAGTIAN